MAEYQSIFTGQQVDNALSKLRDWINADGAYPTVTIDGITYAVVWKVLPTSSNQVYGIGLHPTTGRVYQIYNNKGVYSATALDSYTDTKNTAGSGNTANKLYLVGAPSQTAAGTQTYSNANAYTLDGKLYSANEPTTTLHVFSMSDVASADLENDPNVYTLTSAFRDIVLEMNHIIKIPAGMFFEGVDAYCHPFEIMDYDENTKFYFYQTLIWDIPYFFKFTDTNGTLTISTGSTDFNIVGIRPQYYVDDSYNGGMIGLGDTDVGTSTSIYFRPINGASLFSANYYPEDLSGYLVYRSDSLPTAEASSPDLVEVGGVYYYKVYSNNTYSYVATAKGDHTHSQYVTTDTKNTAGSSNSNSKLFIIGAAEQSANPQTYSNTNVYIGTDHKLYSNNEVVVTTSDSRLSDTRTPKAHASPNTTYGIGTTANYGHVKLATGDMNGASNTDGVAVSKNHTHGQYLLAANYVDTKNTAGSSNSTNKLFLVGAASQDATGVTTYSHSKVYMTDGTLYLTKDTDLSGTANNKPALIIGGADTAAHIEIDPNEIQAKATGTTTAPLYLNNDGGNTYLSGSKTYSDGTYLYSNSTKVSVEGHTHSQYLTGHQNEYGKISDGTNTTTANAVQDTITFSGSGAASVAVSGDTVTVSSVDTKNTAGSINSNNKLFIIGAAEQSANPQTYSHTNAYIGTDHCLYSNGTKVSVEGHTHSQYLTAHPTITKETDTTSTASPAHGGTFTVIDSITRETNGHVTKINTKTVTLPSDNDTKNTAGSSNSASKLFLIGAGSQNASGVATYSNSAVYATAGQLDATKFRVAEKATMQYNSTEDCVEFIFA